MDDFPKKKVGFSEENEGKSSLTKKRIH